MQLLGKTQRREIRVMRMAVLAGGGDFEPGCYFPVPEFRGAASPVLMGIPNPELSGRNG
jgi:hypothetical protein